MKHYKTITAGEIRKYHGHRCKMETRNGDIVEGKISVNDNGEVFVVHNNPEADGDIPNNMMGYEFGWHIYGTRKLRDDNYSGNNMYNWIEIDIDGEEEVEEENSEEFTKEELIKIIKKLI